MRVLASPKLAKGSIEAFEERDRAEAPIARQKLDASAAFELDPDEELLFVEAEACDVFSFDERASIAFDEADCAAIQLKRFDGRPQ